MSTDSSEIVASVILPARNAAPTVVRMIDSLLSQQFDREWELIVVDNGSTDGTADLVRRALSTTEWPPHLRRAEVVLYDEHFGHASPRNRGAALAEGQLLMFCDADDFVTPRWLHHLALATQEHGLAASHQIPDGAVTSAAPPPEGAPVKFGFAVASTGGLGVTRSVFDSLGGFDPWFDIGGADADFSIRAVTQLGIAPSLAPNATYVVGQRTSRSSSFRQGYRYGRSHVRLIHRHGLPSDHDAAWWRMVGRRVRRLIAAARSAAVPTSRPAAARLTGWTLARAVWSVRLRRMMF